MVKSNEEVYFPEEIWDYGYSSGVSSVQRQQIMRGSGGKIHGKIKSEEKCGGGDAGDYDS